MFAFYEMMRVLLTVTISTSTPSDLYQERMHAAFFVDPKHVIAII